MMSLLVLFY
jgi:hypothetical protein